MTEKHNFVTEELLNLSTMGPNKPRHEMLCRLTDEFTSTDAFFKAVRDTKDINKIIETDLEIFESAIAMHMKSKTNVSINLNAETFNDDGLFNLIDKLQNKYLAQTPPSLLDPKKIWLEITEHGGVPHKFNFHNLNELKRLGFNIALDDYYPNPLNEREYYNERLRLENFAPYIDIIKFPFEAMELLREEAKQDIKESTILNLIRQTKQDHPKKQFVMEGVRESDSELFNILKEAGIDFLQESSYKDGKSDPTADTSPATIAPSP